MTAQEKGDFALHQAFPYLCLCLRAVIEQEFALFIWRVGAPVPDNYFTGAIFTLGNATFKGSVVQRVVFHHHGKVLLFRVKGRTFGHRP